MGSRNEGREKRSLTSEKAVEVIESYKFQDLKVRPALFVGEEEKKVVNSLCK